MASTYPATSLLPQSGNVVSRWLLDEASGTRADIVGSRTLTDNNTVAAATPGHAPANAAYDNGADFEAANSEYLSRADDAGLSITGALTVSFWFKPESTGFQDVFSKWLNVNGFKGYRMYAFQVAGGIGFAVSSNGTAETSVDSSTGLLSAGVWAFCTFAYEPSTRMEVYVNGASVGTNTTSIPASTIDNAQPLTIGTFATLGNYTDGVMNDVILWNTALTDAEVTRLYQIYTGFTPTTNYLTNYRGRKRTSGRVSI